MKEFHKRIFYFFKEKERTLFILFFILCITNSCSRIKWAYRFSDWFLQSRLESYFDLNNQQIKEVEKNILKYKKWHQKEMLPKYVSFLEGAKRELENPSILDKVVRVKRMEMEKLGLETALPWVSSSISLYLSLDSSQIKKFEEKNKEKHEERVKKLKDSTPEKRSLERAEKILDFMDIDLKDKQKQIFKDHFKDHPFPFRASFERRKRWNEKILSCLIDNKGKEKKSICLKDHLLNWDKRRTPESKAYRLYIDRLIARVLNSLDKDQKTSLLVKFGEWAMDFKELAKAASDNPQ